LRSDILDFTDQLVACFAQKLLFLLGFGQHQADESAYADCHGANYQRLVIKQALKPVSYALSLVTHTFCYIADHIACPAGDITHDVSHAARHGAYCPDGATCDSANPAGDITYHITCSAGNITDHITRGAGDITDYIARAAGNIANFIAYSARHVTNFIG